MTLRNKITTNTQSVQNERNRPYYNNKWKKIMWTAYLQQNVVVAFPVKNNHSVELNVGLTSS